MFLRMLRKEPGPPSTDSPQKGCSARLHGGTRTGTQDPPAPALHAAHIPAREAPGTGELGVAERDHCLSVFASGHWP